MQASFLEHVLAYKPGMPRRAAGHDEYFFHAAQSLRAQPDLFQVDCAGLLRYPAPDRVHDRTGLLVYLLEHEVTVTALLGHDRVPHYAGDFTRQFRAGKVRYPHAFTRQDRHLVVVQEQHVPGAVQDRRDVGREKEFSLSESDHEGASLARADDDIRVPVRR